MAYHLTKEELDEQFEQFLKESVSDDSVDLGRSSKRPSVLDNLGKPPVRPAKKSSVSVPWWQNDDDDNEEALGKGKPVKRKFIKVKKPQVTDTQEESRPQEGPSPAPVQPASKPHTKALEKANQLAQTRPPNQVPPYDSDRQEILDQSSQCSSRHPTSNPQQSSEVLRRSGGSSHVLPGRRSPSLSESCDDQAESSGSESGRSGDGKTFRKSLRKSQPIQEVDEEQVKEGKSEDEDGVEPGIFSRDSLEPEDSLMASGPTPNVIGLRMDMLEEVEEKATFFARLEGGASSTVDYSNGSRDLEALGSICTTPQRKPPALSTDSHGREEKDGALESEHTPASPVYSEDFEEEQSGKDNEQEMRPKRQGMLAKVSLHDSLNSTDGALRPAVGLENSEAGGGRKEGSESRAEAAPPAHPYAQSGASEMEALQEAYRQISGSGEERGEHPELPGSCLEETHGRSPVSSPPPERPGGTLKHASTVESELPTAEELMRPIGPDAGFARGFSLQPVSEVALTPDPEGQVQGQGSSAEGPDSPAARGGWSGTPREAAPESPTVGTEETPASPRPRPRSIAEEVRRLMEEQEASPQPPPTVCSRQAKKHQVPGYSISSASLSSRKTQSSAVRGKNAESKQSPLATRAHLTGRTNQATKPPSPLVQRKQLSLTQSKLSAPTPTHTAKDSSVRVNSELIASVQSFAAFLQHQIQASSPHHASTPPAAPPQPERREEGSKQVEEEEVEGEVGSVALLKLLRLQLAQKERELHTREEELQREHACQLASVRQENYMLQSKLHSAEEASQKRRWSFGTASEPVTEEKLRLIEKEVKEQETLIQGYHQENEKLYLQLKAIQAERKCNEEAMFTENQRLLSELAHAKDKLSRSSSQRTLGSVGVVEQGSRVAELQGEVQAAQRKEVQLRGEIRGLRQEKQALHVDLELMRKERDLAQTQLQHISGDKSCELKLQEERHREEMAELKRRLQWYADNQELLDKDAARLRAASAETQRLTEQVEKLKMEVGRRASQQQQKVKERAGEAKRIQDLERQVKELEEILRRRNPNSLPALIYAAASASEEEERRGAAGGAGPHTHTAASHTAALLERRVHRLEAELEGRDEEAKRSLRAMEQQYHRIRLQYEQRITELEQLLAHRGLQEQQGGGPSSSGEEPSLSPQRKELEHERDAHRQREEALQAELASVQEQLRQACASSSSVGERERLVPRSPARHRRLAEEAQASRIERLTQELAAKGRAVQELTRTVERLQRERRSALLAPVAERGTGVPARRPPALASMRPQTFPPTQDEKAYQPTAFMGSHISEVQQEREELQRRLEEVQAEREQEREALQAAAKQAHDELQRTQEKGAEQLAMLKAGHQRELEQLLARHALGRSSSKLAELTNQVTTQEIMVQHLREQLKELQGTREALAASKLREETLQNQLARLLEELRQAREAHSPELKHFTSLERKIQAMELRHRQRERELQQVIAQTRLVVEEEQQAEVQRWRALAQGKSHELDAFRLELDSILDVLRELQRQGVVIPMPSHTSTNPITYLS